jgi:hypothetical protein
MKNIKLLLLLSFFSQKNNSSTEVTETKKVLSFIETREGNKEDTVMKDTFENFVKIILFIFFLIVSMCGSYYWVNKVFSPENKVVNITKDKKGIYEICNGTIQEQKDFIKNAIDLMHDTNKVTNSKDMIFEVKTKNNKSTHASICNRYLNENNWRKTFKITNTIQKILKNKNIYNIKIPSVKHKNINIAYENGDCLMKDQDNSWYLLNKIIKIDYQNPKGLLNSDNNVEEIFKSDENIKLIFNTLQNFVKKQEDNIVLLKIKKEDIKIFVFSQVLLSQQEQETILEENKSL